MLRYIHRNPVRAGIVETVGKYPWSSHQGYLSESDEWAWLHKDFIPAMFAEDRGQQEEAYRKFIPEEDSEELLDRFAQKKWPTLFGDENFISWIKETERPDSGIHATGP